MQFNNDYYCDEEKYGFFVPAIIKRGWAAQLCLLEKIDIICRKYNITWYADWGTLLGTIRHQGFIPWDDDIDICIKRKDVDRFITVMKSELPADSMVLSYRNGEFGSIFLRIVSGKGTNFSAEYLSNNCDFPYVVGIDVFILDTLPENEEEITIINSIRQIGFNIFSLIEAGGNVNDQNIYRQIEKIEEMLGTSIARNNNEEFIMSYLSIIDRIYASYDGCGNTLSHEDTKFVYGRFRFDKSWYDDVVYMPFENFSMPVPIGYHGVLTVEYGDYMSIVHARSHDYPFFDKQINYLREIGASKFDFVLCREEVLKYKPRLLEEEKVRKVVFLIHEARSISYFKEIIEKWNSCDNVEVELMQVPYFYKKNLRELVDEQRPAINYESISFYMYDEIDFEKLNADIIYTDCMCDSVNPSMSIHPDCYTALLREKCRQLVYIHCYNSYDIQDKDDLAYFCMRYYLLVPGLLNVDRIIMQSEDSKIMAQEYIRDTFGDEAGDIYKNVFECINN